MLSEFNVRAEAARIEGLEASPIYRARMLLGVARRVRSAARRLAMLSQHHYQSGDPLRGARFQEAMHRLCQVHDEVRERAGAALKGPARRLRYDVAPCADAMPHWEVAK